MTYTINTVAFQRQHGQRRQDEEMQKDGEKSPRSRCLVQSEAHETVQDRLRWKEDSMFSYSRD